MSGLTRPDLTKTFLKVQENWYEITANLGIGGFISKLLLNRAQVVRMASLMAVNEILENFINLVEDGKLVEAELMIKYFNNWNVNLGNETAEAKDRFTELFERFSKLQAKLSKNLQTQNFRFRVNSLAKSIIG